MGRVLFLLLTSFSIDVYSYSFTGSSPGSSSAQCSHSISHSPRHVEERTHGHGQVVEGCAVPFSLERRETSTQGGEEEAGDRDPSVSDHMACSDYRNTPALERKMVDLVSSLSYGDA